MQNAIEASAQLKRQRQEAEANLQAVIEHLGKAKCRKLELIEERRRILATPVTKADFIDYVLGEIDQRAASFPPLFLRQFTDASPIASPVTVELFADLEKSPKILYDPLAGWGTDYGYQVTEFAFCFVFAEQLKKSTRALLEERLDWQYPECISREEAASRIAEIDAEIAELQAVIEDLQESARSFGYVFSEG